MAFCKKIIYRLNRFTGNPGQLLIFFLLLNLTPSLFLTTTEPFNLAGRIALITFPLGVYAILFIALRNIGCMQLMLIPVLILHAFQLVLFYLFGESVIAVDMFLNLATTNVTEASELLNNLWPAIILVCVLYLPTIIIAAIACKRKTYLTPRLRIISAASGIILLIASLGLTQIARNKNTEQFAINQDVYPANVVYNLNFAINKWKASERYPITSRDFHFNAQRKGNAQKREIYVLVIGEAGRANNWQLFGYSRPTNPRLSQTPGLVLYPDAITQANATHKSVPLILSAASASDFNVIYKQKSIIEAFKECGFTTVFLSNQTPNRSFTDYFAAEADYYHNIRPASTGGIYTINNYDEEMLPLCRHYIDSLPNKLFIVFHTYGSHFNYEERYPENFSIFKPDNVTNVEMKNRQELVNAYDNSIRYVDNFLADLIGILNDTGGCTALFYSPDHGEDMLDDSRNRFLHASPNPTYYQLHIPMLMWFSDDYQLEFPQKYNAAIQNESKPVATNAIFHTLLDIASIETNYRYDSLSLVNPIFTKTKRMYLNDHDMPIFFYNAGLKKQDKEMIAKKHLYYSN